MVGQAQDARAAILDALTPAQRRQAAAAMSRRMLSPAAIDAYRKRDREALAIALRLHAGHVHPFDAIGPAPYPPRSASALYWEAARRQRHALAEAAAAIEHNS